jgi:hypothetical protein
VNRIQEIVRLQKEAEASEASASERRWAEAKLIWEELQHKTYRQLSGEIKAEGGSGSLRHLTLMNRCWQYVVVDKGHEHLRFDKLPKFNDVYHSDEVRGESDQEDTDTGSSPERRRKPQPEPDDYSASGLARRIASCTDSLIKNPAFWPLLTDDDIVLLRETKDKLRVLIRDIGR